MQSVCRVAEWQNGRMAGWDTTLSETWKMPKRCEKEMRKEWWSTNYYS